MTNLGKDVSKGNTHLLLVGVQTHRAIMMNSVMVSQEDGNLFISQSCYAPLGHITKGYFTLLHSHLLSHVHCCPRCPSREEWIKEMWCT